MHSTSSSIRGLFTTARFASASLLASASIAFASVSLADTPKAADVPAKGGASTSVLGTQPTLALADENGKKTTLTLAGLGKLTQRTVKAQAHGKSVACSGPLLIDVLATVGTVRGEALRGRNLGLYVRATAADGYVAVFSLAELDPAMSGDDAPIVTATCDGAALDDKDGPLRIVAPRDKRPARWVRQLTGLSVLRAP